MNASRFEEKSVKSKWTLAGFKNNREAKISTFRFQKIREVKMNTFRSPEKSRGQNEKFQLLRKSGEKKIVKQEWTHTSSAKKFRRLNERFQVPRENRYEHYQVTMKLKRPKWTLLGLFKKLIKLKWTLPDPKKIREIYMNISKAQERIMKLKWTLLRPKKNR